MGINIVKDFDIVRLKDEFINDFLNKKYDFFDEHLIIVPNINVKKYLELEFAKKNGSIIGLNILYLESGLLSFYNKLDGFLDRLIFLNDKDNLIYLQLLVILILERYSDNEDLKVFSDFFIERKSGEVSGDSKGKKINFDKLFNLSAKITYYLREYQYQKVEIIDKWKDDKLYFEGSNSLKYNIEIEKAYRFIYRKIFHSGSYNSESSIKQSNQKESDNKTLFNELSYIERLNQKNSDYKYTTFFDYFENNIKNRKIDSNEIITKFGNKFEIFIFGHSQMASYYLKLINTIAQFVDINLYQLDFTINKNNYFIEKYAIAMKKFDKNLENDISKDIIKKYLYEKEEINNDDKNRTILNILKQAIINKECINEGKNDGEIKQDTSLQIIGCPTLKSEVETVYNSILYNLKNDTNLKLTDIAILVPDMEKYRYFIESVFDENGLIPYNLNDFSVSKVSNFVKLINSYFELINSDFKKDVVIDFIENPIVMNRFKITNQELMEIKNIISKLKIFYSINFKDKKNISNFDQSPNFTWSLGFIKLILSNFFYLDDLSNQDSKNELSEFFSIDSFNVESEENLSKIVELLFKILSFFNQINQESNKLKTIKSIKENILKFIDTFYGKDEDSSDHDIFESSVKDKVVSFLNNLDQFDEFFELDEKENREIYFNKIDFVKKYLLSNINDISGRRNSYLSDGVVISKLQPMKPIPFKIAYIIGLTDSDFPKLQEFSSLDLRNIDSKESQDFITTEESDNYLFLETLMSTQEKLYLIYNNKDLETDKEILPSMVINDLISYIETNLFNGKKFYIFKTNLNKEIKNEIKQDDEILKDNPLKILEELEKEHKIIYLPNKVRLIESLNSIKNKNSNFEKILNVLQKKDKNENTNVKVKIDDLFEFITNPKSVFLKRKIGIESSYYDSRINDLIEPYTLTESEVNSLLVKKSLLQDVDIDKNFEKFKLFGTYPEEDFLNPSKEYINNNELKKNISECNNIVENEYFEETFQEDRITIYGYIKDLYIDRSNKKLYLYFPKFYPEKIYLNYKSLSKLFLSIFFIKSKFEKYDFSIVTQKDTSLIEYKLVNEKDLNKPAIIETFSELFEKILSLYREYILDEKNKKIFSFNIDFFDTKKDSENISDDKLYEKYKEFREERYFDDKDFNNYFRINDDEYLIEDFIDFDDFMIMKEIVMKLKKIKDYFKKDEDKKNKDKKDTVENGEKEK